MYMIKKIYIIIGQKAKAQTGNAYSKYQKW